MATLERRIAGMLRTDRIKRFLRRNGRNQENHRLLAKRRCRERIRFALNPWVAIPPGGFKRIIRKLCAMMLHGTTEFHARNNILR